MRIWPRKPCWKLLLAALKSREHFHAYLLGTLLGLPLPIALYCLFFDTLTKSLPG